MGLLCSFSGFLIDQQLEKSGDLTAEGHLVITLENQTLRERLHYNFEVCKHALEERAIYMTILFFAIEGFTVPNFFEFIYFYAVNVLNVT